MLCLVRVLAFLRDPLPLPAMYLKGIVQSTILLRVCGKELSTQLHNIVAWHNSAWNAI